MMDIIKTVFMSAPPWKDRALLTELEVQTSEDGLMIFHSHNTNWSDFNS